jgi:hypothetical protein
MFVLSPGRLTATLWLQVRVALPEITSRVSGVRDRRFLPD